ncbi:GNAT family N-acetyltransferase [Fulvimonas soli]|jgi:putative acetyltransferase|uniref:Putative acetyltransferase n=1 Tax=Fulvimonas soli TaxID=155197 RepID=A0A316I3W9_9GAMM|nr:GNAT family N-acetyltransferase [Fulvimonas soli]PWK87686.1 putative acetyltransferase [Fulvimonas soli]TNY27960.1 GNAT family N-acetyltransferase [Fulvimonas soli]
MKPAPRLTFAVDDPGAPDVLPLLRELDGYLARLHPAGTLQPVALEALRRANVSVITARVDGRPVACGACVDEGDYVEIKRMYVLPACRGLGLGRQLLDAMEDHVRRHGGRLVRLETGTAQAEALELYERAGYRRCPPFGEHHASPRSICMEKRLA